MGFIVGVESVAGKCGGFTASRKADLDQKKRVFLTLRNGLPIMFEGRPVFVSDNPAFD